jgi:hypothetical protein
MLGASDDCSRRRNTEMSMNAIFVQVDTAELSRFQADPNSVEALFEDSPPLKPLGAGPQFLADAVARLDPELQRKIAERIGVAGSEFAAGVSGDQVFRPMEERRARGFAQASAAGTRETLSLQKLWHGVHFVLCGSAEASSTLLSQAVLGGVALGDDDEGFAGYGPARYFAAAAVAELSRP